MVISCAIGLVSSRACLFAFLQLDFSLNPIDGEWNAGGRGSMRRVGQAPWPAGILGLGTSFISTVPHAACYAMGPSSRVCPGADA
uniref:Uncharacterized protein n=1 Tax=Arundo donax TaxID=35708 RepID=A0A0A9BHC8_ARUDO